MAPLLQLPEHAVELELLLQGPQGLFNVPGMDRYFHERPLPPP